MRYFNVLLCVLLISCLAGCLPGAISISAINIEPGAIGISVDGVSGSCGLTNGAAIQSVWIGKMQPNGVAQTVWQLKSVNDNGHQVRFVKYGVVPDGFVEIEESMPLISGYQYDAELSGHGCSGGIKFTVK